MIKRKKKIEKEILETGKQVTFAFYWFIPSIIWLIYASTINLPAILTLGGFFALLFYCTGLVGLTIKFEREMGK